LHDFNIASVLHHHPISIFIIHHYPIISEERTLSVAGVHDFYFSILIERILFTSVPVWQDASKVNHAKVS
jgi:hypothetical protein